MHLQRLILEGFKSFRDRTEVLFGDFTLLAGANNAGKSALMQPLLLMKQTLEANFDPGPLLLRGAHFAPSSAEALFWSAQGKRAPRVRFGVDAVVGGRVPEQVGYEVVLEMNPEAVPPFTIVEGIWRTGRRSWTVRPEESKGAARVERFFAYGTENTELQQRVRSVLEGLIGERMIHVPAARNLSTAVHPLAALQGDVFRGRFVEYVPTLIHTWQRLRASVLARLADDLRALELGSGVKTAALDEPLSGTVAIQVGRLPTAADATNEQEWANLVELGSGVSHALPMLVALLVAGEGWLVYIEEPEAHLHPRAIHALPRLIRDAVRRGAQIVVETHSELLLLSTQALIAKGEFEGYAVRLNWLSRDDEGVSRCAGVALDERGTLGDLPVDLGKVSLQILEDFLNATIR